MEGIVRTSTACVARSAPSLLGKLVADIPVNSELRVLRDEDRDYIKVVYDGLPVYAPRTAVTPVATTLTPAGAATNSFALSTERPDLGRFLVANVPAPTSLSLGFVAVWNVLWLFGSPGAPGEPYREIYLALYSAFLLIGIVWSWRTAPKSYAGVSATSITLRGYGNRMIPLEKIESIGRRDGRWGDLLAISCRVPPWGATLLYGRPVGRPLAVTLKKGSSVGLMVRYRRVLINPQDHTGFLKAVYEFAPGVRIDPALLRGAA